MKDKLKELLPPLIGYIAAFLLCIVVDLFLFMDDIRWITNAIIALVAPVLIYLDRK